MAEMNFWDWVKIGLFLLTVGWLPMNCFVVYSLVTNRNSSGSSLKLWDKVTLGLFLLIFGWFSLNIFVLGVLGLRAVSSWIWDKAGS